MSEDRNDERASDGMADSIVAVGVISIVIFTLYFWLSGMPS